MKLAADSHQRLEEFFREHFADERFILPTINIYCGKFTHYFTNLIGVHGITFGRRIFILPDLVGRNHLNESRLSENLAAHEIMHSLQFQKHGFFGFFYQYLGSYWKNLRGKERWDFESRQMSYFEIPFEVQAREVAEKFVEWSGDRRKSESSQAECTQ
jgi:hypothetical protein